MGTEQSPVLLVFLKAKGMVVDGRMLLDERFVPSTQPSEFGSKSSLQVCDSLATTNVIR